MSLSADADRLSAGKADIRNCLKEARRAGSNLPTRRAVRPARRALETAVPARWRACGASRAREFVARRSKVAEAKIAQAETQAVADVRAAAAEAAVAAAEKILTQSAKGEVADRLLADGIRDVKAKLN